MNMQIFQISSEMQKLNYLFTINIFSFRQMIVGGRVGDKEEAEQVSSSNWLREHCVFVGSEEDFSLPAWC